MYHKDIEDMTRGIAGKNIYIVENGTERIDSVKNGLDKALSLEESYDNSENGGMAYVMIHDGARPLISEKAYLRFHRECEEIQSNRSCQ